MLKRFIVLFLLLCFNVSYAAPSQIIIIRHGDKLLQANTGPTLSAKGQIRAINFAFYYLQKFGMPDYVFASNPTKDTTSIRELQTVAPLVNIMQQRDPENSSIGILHPYSSKDYTALATYILDSDQFDGKKIVVCWSHGKIPKLAEKLGVNQKLSKWPADDFDSVYVLRYNNKGDLKDFEILHQQYPVSFSGTWADLESVNSVHH